jgi:hypothetical protein
MQYDPTANEMRAYLKTLAGAEYDDFSGEAAIYWFANDWHGGQSSNLYSALSTSEFSPGPLCNGPEPETTEESYYAELEEQFTKH